MEQQIMTNQERHKRLNAYWQIFLNSETEEDSKDVFSSIYSLCVNDLLAYGQSLGFDMNLCEDAIHNVFCTLYLKRKELTEVRSLPPYLFRAFRNDMLNMWRKLSKLSEIDINRLSFTTEVTILDTIIDEEEKSDIKEIIEDLLNTLTNRQREAIYLRYMQGLSYEEIAELLEISPGSVRKLVYRAIMCLREESHKIGNPLTFLFLLLFFTNRA